jgi:predicted nucleic acid-binding protein
VIVVSDTSPLNYLILIGADQALPSLFGRVLAPPEVLVEMQHAKAEQRTRRGIPRNYGTIVRSPRNKPDPFSTLLDERCNRHMWPA